MSLPKATTSFVFHIIHHNHLHHVTSTWHICGGVTYIATCSPAYAYILMVHFPTLVWAFKISKFIFYMSSPQVATSSIFHVIHHVICAISLSRRVYMKVPLIFPHVLGISLLATDIVVCENFKLGGSMRGPCTLENHWYCGVGRGLPSISM